MANASDSCIIAVDQGTSSTKCIAVNQAGNIVAEAKVPIGQTHPGPGQVEQDANEILSSVLFSIDSVAHQVQGRQSIAGLGLSSQRESALVWDRSTGEPVGPMLGWQDRRTVPAAEQMRVKGNADDIRARSGLPLDPMFSALKLSWLLDSVDPDRRRSNNGELAVGTVDSWLLTKLTGEHRIEAGNASRTQLMNLANVEWDPALLDIFSIPEAVLPQIVPSNATSAAVSVGAAAGCVIGGVLGDSHAALYANGAREPGAIKATYGTGSSVMGLVSDLPKLDSGLVATLAWQTGSAAYAGEGNILSAGSTLVWLAELLNSTPDELMKLAETSSDANSVDLVPAFAGLGAPWWDDQAVAAITGLDLGSSRASLAKAAADSIVLQVEDVVSAFDRSGSRCDQMLVDGGPTANPWLMQRQANLSRRTVVRRAEVGLSALGAAHMAGATLGLFDADKVLVAAGEPDSFSPTGTEAESAERVDRWHTAIRRSRNCSGSQNVN